MSTIKNGRCLSLAKIGDILFIGCDRDGMMRYSDHPSRILQFPVVDVLKDGLIIISAYDNMVTRVCGTVFKIKKI